MEEVIAFVHARYASSRIPRKNLRLLSGRPLIAWAINNARRCMDIDRVIIDSESDEILEVGERFGAEPLKRPLELALDIATGDDLAFWQASNFPESEICVQVVPTSPFISPETISGAISAVQCEGVNSAFSVREEPLYTWDNNWPSYLEVRDGELKIKNSQDLEPTIYETTGLYANRTKWILRYKRRLDVDSHVMIKVSPIEAVDINTIDDFDLARAVADRLILEPQKP
jgi:CMP-N-acetylneuraminic acid synthetase